MFDRIRPLILQVLRVPPEPHAPLGAEGSLRVFRAANNFYRLRVAAWAFAQVATVVGLIFSIGFLRYIESQLTTSRATQQARATALPAAPANPPPANPVPSAGPAEGASPAASDDAKKSSTRRRNRQPQNWDGLVRFVDRVPWALVLIKLFEAGAVTLFVLSLPVTFAAVRLDYDYRWYLVTDRSLRIREGIWRLHETTMSFANLQQVEVTQGPLQRILGIADVRVQSAGGGGGGEGKHGQENSMHVAVFHGIANAPEVRDLILDRLRRFREAGLGDPDETHAPIEGQTLAEGGAAEMLAAAGALRDEARALRRALGDGSTAG